jgi:hypothetical protein
VPDGVDAKPYQVQRAGQLDRVEHLRRPLQGRAEPDSDQRGQQVVA